MGFDGERWVDESGRDWSHKVLFKLPDLDLFTLDAMAATPRLLGSQQGLGTVLFNVTSNPATGAIYVSNTEARNRVRFEGPGTAASSVRGNIAEQRISVVRGGTVTANHLNPHVDFSLPEGASLPASDKALSLAQPQEMVLSPDGDTLYLAAFGSNRIAANGTASCASCHIFGDVDGLAWDQADGRRVFLEEATTGGALTCDHCHVLDVDARQFGTAGLMTNEGPGITEDFKVVHLRNLYQKVGMFGASVPRPGQQAQFTGDQVRGFGLLHDGGIDTVSNFLASSVFGFASDAQREQVVDFMFAFDGNLAPIVGQQLTIGADPDAATRARLDLLLARAGAAPSECDLVVHGVLEGEQRGALLLANGRFRTDRSGEDSVGLQQLLSIATGPGQELTFTCVPPGMGQQMALDRNG
ncbi:MAG: hypothetical protein R6W80_15925 [Haliea sp.]